MRFSVITCVLIRTFPFKIMSLSTEQLPILLNRLAQAEKRAKLLAREVQSITKDIEFIKSSIEKVDCNKVASNPITAVVKRENPFEEPNCNTKRGKFDFSEENGYVVIYTDGACENNGKAGAKAGIGVWFGPNHPLNVSEPVVGRATNNTAEIQAITKALRIAQEHQIENVVIKTDSEFTINCMTKWIHGWKKKGWITASKQPVKNKEDLVVLDDMCQKLNVRWEHVRGHRGVIGNEGADALAVRGAKLYKST